MLLRVNGEQRSAREGASLLAFIEEAGLDPRKVAVERNGAIAPRSLWGDTRLEAGDALEIVRIVGGG